MVRRLFFLAVVFSTAAAFGQLPTPVGTVNLPAPDSNAFATSFRYDSGGTLYAWDGASVWSENSDGSFTNIGAAPAGNSADTGPINFSQNGSQILIGNGSGGLQGGSYAGQIFSMPKPGGSTGAAVGNVPYQQDFLPVPSSSTIVNSSTKYFVDEGDSSYDASSVSVFDSSTGADQLVISNVPGASASIAINPATGALYAEAGYSFGPGAGVIRSFSLTAIANAFANKTPIDFSTGTVFNASITPQSGAGMFFDQAGYLFAGGDGGISVFSPTGTAVFVEDPTGNAYSTIAYNPANNQVLEVPYGSPGVIYNAADFDIPEPASLLVVAAGGLLVLRRRPRGA